MNKHADALPQAAPPTGTEDPEAVEKLLEYAWTAYQRHVEDFGALDSKAATLSGFISIVLTLSTALLAYQGATSSQETILDWWALATRLVFSAAVLMLAASFFFCLLALRCRENKNQTSIANMVKEYDDCRRSDNPKRDVMIAGIKSLELAEKSRIENNNQKSRDLQRATAFLFCAFAFAVLGLIGQLIEIWKPSWEILR